MPTFLDGAESTAPTAELDTDEALARRAASGDATAFELLMRRHNRRVYRAVRAVLRDGPEVEDAMQQAYLQAFTHLDQFKGDARFSTWLCRIAFNEALARVRGRRRFVSVDADGASAWENTLKSTSPDPEHLARDRELGRLLEVELDRLPDIYRAVVMLREVEGLSTTETAAVLDLEEPAVKTRLHRARALLRTAVEQRLGASLAEAYEFGAERCDRVVADVLARLAARG